MKNEEGYAKSLLKDFVGHEVWTNAFTDRFEERVCVGIIEKDGAVGFVKDGEYFHDLTDEEAQGIWDDFCRAELPSNWAEELEAEMASLEKNDPEIRWIRTAFKIRELLKRFYEPEIMSRLKEGGGESLMLAFSQFNGFIIHECEKMEKEALK